MKSLRRNCQRNACLFAAVLVAQMTIGAPAGAQTPQPSSDQGFTGRLAPYVPTPAEVVDHMLELAHVDRYDRVYDLGSGDGRIVIRAAEKFGAEAVGVELDDALYKQSSERIRELGLEKKAKILHANMFDVGLRRATVVTLYLLTVVNERLRPKLEKELRPGARIISHDFKVTGWTPEKTEIVMSDSGVSHTLYLYVRP